MPKRLLVCCFVLTLLVGSMACGSAGSSASGRLSVVATTTQIGDFASNVGGDRIRLTVLLKPNQDAHDFEPKPSQIKALAKAAVVLRNGIGLDAYVKKAAPDASRVTIVSDGLNLRDFPGQEEGGRDSIDEAAGHDPHVWFSIANAQKMVENIRDAFVAADPANADYYRQNATAYIATLTSLDGEIKASVGTLPASCRKLVTNHDFLGYYASTYGFTIIGAVIPSTSTEAQASAADVAQIVQKIKDQHVPAIFAEASINPVLMNQVGREANVKVVSDLYSDSLGTKGSDGATYVDMMRADTKKIVDALSGCTG